MLKISRMLMAVLVLLVTLLVQSGPLPAQEKPFDMREVERWLARSGVKLLAVDFYSQGCEPCKRDLPKWQALHDKYAKRGFRFALVKVQDEGACITLPAGFKPDDQRCDFDGQVALSWNVKSFPKSFLWNWRGEKLVDHGDFESVKTAVETYFAHEPRILVDGEGEGGAALRDEVRAALTAASKFEVLASEKEQAQLKALRAKIAKNPAYDEKQECALGVALPPNSRLVAAKRGERLNLTLTNLESGCVVRQQFTNLGAGQTAAVKEAVEGLVQALAGEVQSPTGGVAKAKPAPAKAGVNSIGAMMVKIPAGSFMMGSPSGEEGRDNDEKQHRVTLTKGFLLGATEVTQGQWQAVMGSNPSSFKDCGAECPVENVSWTDVVEFCNKLSDKEGLTRCYSGREWNRGCTGYRLPTEAEWEYAARAGSSEARYGEVGSVAWYDQNSGSKTHPAGQKQANAWGLYDMLGNVWEWVWDWYGAYPSGDATDPVGPTSGSYRVVRGGSWFIYAQDARAADRNADAPGHRVNDLGFRLSRSLP